MPTHNLTPSHNATLPERINCTNVAAIQVTILAILTRTNIRSISSSSRSSRRLSPPNHPRYDPSASWRRRSTRSIHWRGAHTIPGCAECTDRHTCIDRYTTQARARFTYNHMHPPTRWPWAMLTTASTAGDRTSTPYMVCVCMFTRQQRDTVPAQTLRPEPPSHPSQGAADAAAPNPVPAFLSPNYAHTPC